MKTKYTVYYPEGHAVEHETDLPAEPNYDDIKAVVELYLPEVWFERVLVERKGELVDMFVDEMGHPKGLPMNREASKFYRGSLPIVGPAVVFHRRVWF